MGSPTKTQAWENLSGMTAQNAAPVRGFIRDNDLDIELDVSKSIISDEIWSELYDLARQQNIESCRDEMFRGDAINITENRAVGHMWLRSGERPEVMESLGKMRDFVGKTHEQNKFTDIVHIGIGGSDLGPRMICRAMQHLPRKMNVHFVSNIDAADIEGTLSLLNPKTTIFVIASKTFTTIETMMNAKYAREWLGELNIADHMIALSTNASEVAKFGINTNNMFPFWDWVGGRYSVWSSIGMPIALTYGFDEFQNFLDGAKAMDDHFLNTDIESNLPVILALYGIWHRNFMKRPALAILPYANNLDLMPNFLQQLDMESNGKSVDCDGEFITDYETGPIIFGQAGTNGQHAFHQWLHQGTDIVPCEFITFTNTIYNKQHQEILNANASAQAEAFHNGFESLDNKHRHYQGNRPSINIVGKKLTPYVLGQIVALYEHKIFVQGVIWNINSFDQFGVELGKLLANQLLSKNQ